MYLSAQQTTTMEANNTVREVKPTENHFFNVFGQLMSKNDLENKDVISMYEDFAESYEHDLGELNFVAAELTAQYFHKHAQRFKLDKDCLILDIGAGTGRVGQLLKQQYGYTSVDAIDPSASMLQKAKERNIYRRTFEGLVGEGHTMPIDDGIYDGVVVSGVLVPGHMQYSAFLDILRVLKPGGLIVNTMREEFTWQFSECHIRVPFGKWEAEGRWNIIEWAIPDRKYFADKDALVHVYRKPLNT